MRRRVEIILIGIAFLLLLIATVPWTTRLGLEYDEAHFLPLAVKIADGAEERLDLPWGITVADRPIPFMTMPYVGSLDSFLYAIPFRLFGSKPHISRATNISLGILIFALAWWITRREAGRWAALATLALLLFDVELVLHIPTHFGPFLLQQLLTLAAIASLQQWWRSSRPILFFLAVASLALAFHEKLTFIWILTSLALGILIFRGAQTWRQSRWWYYPAGLLLALFLVSPILYFAYSAPEVILGFGKANAKAPDNWGLLLSSRWHAFDMMLRGNWTMEFTAGAVPASLHRGPALLLLFFLGLASAIYSRQKLALILYTTALGVWTWNLAFPDAGRMHHVLLMAPFWQIAAAIAIQCMARPVQILSLLLLLWSGWDAARNYTWYTSQIRQYGGINHWSDMTSRAVEWFNLNPQLEAVTTSWGVERPLTTLSRGRLHPVEHYFDTMTDNIPPDAVAQLKQLIGKERQVWLVSSVMPAYQQQWERVVRLAESMGKRPYHLKTFPSRDGRFHLDAFTFTPTRPVPSSWSPAPGPAFPLTGGQFRFELAGRANGETESITVLWLDASGKPCRSDTRNLYWAPHIRQSTRFEFSPTYWPYGFNHAVLSEETPVSVRIESNLQHAKIQSIEVASP